ncbi:UNVERIFIED_CONTAM: Ca13 [Trichonephila clavipes]
MFLQNTEYFLSGYEYRKLISNSTVHTLCVLGLTGGPLEHSYQLVQFHCHWGKCCNTGSEHTIDGKGYAAELHLVHWNVDLYNSVEEALASPKGLAVIGIFFQVGKHNDELMKITNLLHDIVNKGEECSLPKEVDPAGFIPGIVFLLIYIKKIKILE